VRRPARGAIRAARFTILIAALLAGCTAAPAAPHPISGHPTTGHPTTGHPTTGHPATGHPATLNPARLARRVAGAPVTLAGYYAQKLHWRTCDQGFQCARLLVPFDYARPAWRRFSLPVIRLPATDPAHRIGSLVINPGGPGGSGVSYALDARSVVAAAVRARFDVVGFDPRGVGGSEPAVHCLTGPQLDRYFETDDAPADPAQLATFVSESKLFASGCERDSGPLLPYVGTRSAARDMDVLRAALGDRKLTYLGKSYGTYLGTWYAQLFPAHVRALVLDGALDPDASGLSMNVVQSEGFEVALRSFVTDCLTRANCPLGQGGTGSAASTSRSLSASAASAASASASAVSAGIARVQALITKATAHPLRNDLGDGQTANGALLLSGIAAALYSKGYWPTLRSALQEAFGGDGTVLVELGNALYERSPAGTYSNLADANLAVDCVDRSWPRGLAAWSSAAAAAAEAAPQFGAAIMWGSLPCAYWPVQPAAQPAIQARGAPPILVVGNKRDPATPYQWAEALAGDLAPGVLLGWNGDGHTAYMMGSSCIDSIVNRYLLTLAVPRSGTLCPAS
jgi:pimeloyl-ACP methyl ester carboxylesterase